MTSLRRLASLFAPFLLFFSMAAQFELRDPPTDGISTVQFAPDNNFLLVSSWDSQVRLYDVQMGGVVRSRYSHLAGVLDCCFGDTNQQAFSGSLDRTLKTMDFAASSERVMGTHDKPIRCVNYSSTYQTVLTGGWDAVLKSWDVRTQHSTGQFSLPAKCLSMSVIGNRVVVATGERHIYVFDLRQMSVPEQRRESSLKHQTRCVRCYPDGTGFAVSSIEGRVAMEYFNPAKEVQDRKYAFKCHRATDAQAGTDTAYPVNALGFHPIYGTFATGGCDGQVIMWDGQAKKRLQHPWKFQTSISSLCFNSQGTMLAIAASYTYEQGQKDHPSDAIYIRTVTEAEVKNKPKQ